MGRGEGSCFNRSFTHVHTPVHLRLNMPPSPTSCLKYVWCKAVKPVDLKNPACNLLGTKQELYYTHASKSKLGHIPHPARQDGFHTGSFIKRRLPCVSVASTHSSTYAPQPDPPPHLGAISRLSAGYCTPLSIYLFNWTFLLTWCQSWALYETIHSKIRYTHQT
jgi:hypothetical protein